MKNNHPNISLRSLLLPLKDLGIFIPLKKIDNNLPQKGLIYDLGCGEGYYSKILSKNKSRKLIGIDNDLAKLKSENDKNLEFKKGNILKVKLGKASGVILIDVLHHLDKKEHEKIIKKIHQCLKKGGVLIIKEIDSQEFLRSHLSRFWDYLFFPKDKIYYRSMRELKGILTKNKFKIKVQKPCPFFPGSTTLYICKKV